MTLQIGGETSNEANDKIVIRKCRVISSHQVHIALKLGDVSIDSGSLSQGVEGLDIFTDR